MNFFTAYTLCVTVALASARPQSGNQFGSSPNNQQFQGDPQNNQFIPNPNNPFLQNGQNQAGGSQGTMDLNQIFQQIDQLQQPNQSQNQNQQQVPVTSSTPPAVSETSPQFLRCLSTCPVLSQYSPVCGSNQQTYPNSGRLDCVNQCGRRLNQNWQEITTAVRRNCTPGGRVA